MPISWYPGLHRVGEQFKSRMINKVLCEAEILRHDGLALRLRFGYKVAFMYQGSLEPSRLATINVLVVPLTASAFLLLKQATYWTRLSYIRKSFDLPSWDDKYSDKQSST
jgi:hypothetical protein